MTKFVKQKVEIMETPVTVWTLVAISITLIVMYAFLINASIVNIVKAKSVRSEIASLSTHVGALESKYLLSKSALTMDDARALGFSESASAPIYITKGETQASLSFNR